MKRRGFLSFIGVSVSILMMFGMTGVYADESKEAESDIRLITYDAPEGVGLSQKYTVKARPQGSGDDAWQEIDVYGVQVMSNGTREAAMAYFDCTGPVDVRVTVKGKIDYFDDTDEKTGLKKGLLKKGTTTPFRADGSEEGASDVQTVDMPIDTRIYPESYGIEPEYEEGGDTIDFTVNPGQRIVLDPNGDTRQNLQIWADYPLGIPSPEELEKSGKTVTVIDAAEGDSLESAGYDTDVVYVKPGYYSGDSGWANYYVKSNQTWYFEGGAVINGTLNLDYTTNAQLIGHGLIYRPQSAAMTVNDTQSTYIDGMMGLNHGWNDNGGYFINIANSKNVYIKNLKSIARHKWGDTMDIFCSEDVTVEGCFFRGNDDCIAIYGPRWTGNYWGDTGNVRDIKVKNCVLMPDLARPIHFGTHGDSASPNGGRVIDNCRFEDIDILTYNKYAYNPRSGGRMPQAIRMDVSEGNTVSNVYFNNIRIRDYMANKLCELYLTTQDRYGTYTFPGKGVNNVYFKDIDYKNIDPTHGGRIEGYKTAQGTDGMTRNVTFENLKINGKVALGPEEAQINIGSNTKNIRFVESDGSKYIYDPSAVPEDIWPEYYDYAATAEASAEKSENGSAPSAAIDGDDNTVWYSATGERDPSYDSEAKTVAGDGITLDLGEQRHISGVRIKWENPAPTHDYRIYVSKDGIDWSVGHTDEHDIGAVNSKARAEYNKRVKTTWFTNQYDPNQNQDYIIGRYVKVIPLARIQLDIATLEVLGTEKPEADVELADSEQPSVREQISGEIVDDGTANGIPNGGERSIYASDSGQIMGDRGAVTWDSELGKTEVTKEKRSAVFRFDLSNAGKEGMVIKSAKLRLTPMVSKTNLSHNVYKIDNDSADTSEETKIAEFSVPRVETDDFNKSAGLVGISDSNITEYPDELANWQTDADITGEVAAATDALSLHIAYGSGNAGKTEYATSNITGNDRLSGGQIPFLYSGGITPYSKWIYPQLVLTYSDNPDCISAYNDFISAKDELTRAVVKPDAAVSAPKTANNSTVTLESADDSGIVTVTDTEIKYNPDYTGNGQNTKVKLTVTKGEASYSMIVPVRVEGIVSYEIHFATDKNPLGDMSVIIEGKSYRDGIAYAQEGSTVTVSPEANMGYTPLVSVTKAADGSRIPLEDNSFAMPPETVNISVDYTKSSQYGTSRIAASNSVSVKSDGSIQSPDLVIGSGRLTFVKFDLSGYNADVISDSELSFTPSKNASPNTKAIFRVPNNDWDEGTVDRNFSLDGSADADISNFKYTDETGGEQTISLLNGENHGALIMPDAEDASTAAGGILKDYYAASTGRQKTNTIDVTEAIKEALAKGGGIVTLMIYSNGSGNDVYSVNGAPNLLGRPTLTVTESAEYLPDSELVTEIKTEEDLEKFAMLVNGGNSYEGKTVTLANSIDLSEKYNENGLSWTPIGTVTSGESNPFMGTFDGLNNTVSGLYINDADGKVLGLFGEVSGEVKNLTVKGEIIGGSVIGGIAASCDWSVSNCHSEVDINAQRDAGGIVGTLANGGIISSCDNKGNIKPENKETYAGGIVGHNIDGTVKNCINSGKIENGLDGFRNKLGGIVGFLDNGTIKDSANIGEVTSDAAVASYTGDRSQNYVGGIAGYSSYGTILGCSNEGRVHNAVDYSGGIAGYLQCDDLISDCVNTGEVSAENYSGDVVGYINRGNTIEESGGESSPAPNTKTVYAEDGVVIIATYTSEDVLKEIQMAGTVSEGEAVREFNLGQNQKVFIWTSTETLKPVGTKTIME